MQMAPADQYIISHIDGGSPSDYQRVITYSSQGVSDIDGWNIHLQVQPLHADGEAYSSTGEEVIELFYSGSPRSVTENIGSILTNQPYGVVQVTYESPHYSFSMVAQENTPEYFIDENLHLYSVKEHSEYPDWTDLGELTEISLTKDNFDKLFTSNSGDGWYIRESASAIRKNTEKAWTVIYDQDKLYYVLQQKNGELYLAYGYYDYSEKDDPGSDDTSIRWLYLLARKESEKPTLSLNDVIILSQKGNELSWRDFEDFEYIETGSGLYIRRYEINDLFHFSIGGAGPNSEPMYMHLGVNGEDPDAFIEIRDGGVTEFISEHNTVSINFTGNRNLGLNAEIIEVDSTKRILYVKDIDKQDKVFGDRCAIDCSYAISRDNIFYVNYDDPNDVRTIEFDDFEVGDAIIIGMYDSEKEKAFNGSAVAEQIQLGTQRLNYILVPAYEPLGVSGDNVQELSRISDHVKWIDGLGIDELAPGAEIVSDFVINVEEDGTDLLITITWGAQDLVLKYGIRAEDGTEFFQEKPGGSSMLRMKDIPAGTYRLFVKNSEAYAGIPAYENPEDFPDVSFNATGAILYAFDN